MTAPKEPQKVLVVDHDTETASILSDALGKKGIQVIPAKDLSTALYQFNHQRIDVAVIDSQFQGLNGLALLQKFRKSDVREKRHTGIIMCFGAKRSAGMEMLMREFGDVLTVSKPLNATSFLSILSKAYGAKVRGLALEETRGRVMALAKLPDGRQRAIEEVKSNLSSLGSAGLEMLLELYEQAGEYDEALNIVDSMVRQNPTNIMLTNARGRLLLKLNRTEEALKVLEDADKVAPGNIQRLEELAEAYLEVNQPEQSAMKFKQLIALHPEAEDYKFKVFDRLYAKGHDLQATALGRETASPMEIVRHYNNKGVAMSKQGKYSLALGDYENALKFYPKFKENYRILFNIALAHVSQKQQGWRAQAIKNLEECLSRKPDFDKALTLLKKLKPSNNVKAG